MLCFNLDSWWIYETDLSIFLLTQRPVSVVFVHKSASIYVSEHNPSTPKRRHSKECCTGCPQKKATVLGGQRGLENQPVSGATTVWFTQGNSSSSHRVAQLVACATCSSATLFTRLTTRGHISRDCTFKWCIFLGGLNRFFPLTALRVKCFEKWRPLSKICYVLVSLYGNNGNASSRKQK